MKTVVKINPEKEYESAKKLIESVAPGSNPADIVSLDNSVDNLKTVINVLLERATPKKKLIPPKRNKKNNRSRDKLPKDFKKLPSEKFPDLEIEEKTVKNDQPPACPSCDQQMKESGLYKVSEKLEVIPKKYFIVRNKRVIYNCSRCNGSMQNAASLPSISRNSNYGDSLVLDAALSKYCDLIPMERYSAIAARSGVEGLPPNSLITTTHTLASFLAVVYCKIKDEVLNSYIVKADETPHRMLEGDKTSNWYLWGFFSDTACFFENHGTRSGDVPLSFLSQSKAKFLMTDGYSGYKRALRELRDSGINIIEVYCNAHAFRYFKDAATTWKEESEEFISIFQDIFNFDRQGGNRHKMRPLFYKLKDKCEQAKTSVMPNSSLDKAINYFLNHFKGLTECIFNEEIPLTNNSSERSLRSPVIGRKTWIGTHSKRGAATNAVLFTIVETCKLIHLNPRNYLPWVVERIHKKMEVLTPSQYLSLINSG